MKKRRIPVWESKLAAPLKISFGSANDVTGEILAEMAAHMKSMKQEQD